MPRQEIFWIVLLKVGVTGFFAMALWLNWGSK